MDNPIPVIYVFTVQVHLLLHPSRCIGTNPSLCSVSQSCWPFDLFCFCSDQHNVNHDANELFIRVQSSMDKVHDLIKMMSIRT